VFIGPQQASSEMSFETMIANVGDLSSSSPRSVPGGFRRSALNRCLSLYLYITSCSSPSRWGLFGRLCVNILRNMACCDTAPSLLLTSRFMTSMIDTLTYRSSHVIPWLPVMGKTKLKPAQQK
jgi:hypothetical protein